MKTILKILLLILPFFSVGQNLVLNPSFEDAPRLPTGVSQLGYAFPWSSPNIGTPDLYSFNSKKKKMQVPKNDFGYQEALNGNLYAGIVTSFGSKSYHGEYIQGELSDTLIKGKVYLIEFYYSLAERSTCSEQSLGAILVGKRLYPADNFPKHYSYSAKTQNQMELSDKENWNKVSGKFKADGNETHIVIGKIDVVKKNSGNLCDDKLAYYYIDNVSVTLIEDSIIKDSVPKYSIDKNIVLENVFFESGSSTLKEESYPTLNELFLNLSKIDNLSEIQISGHTDNVGKEEDNLKLSEARAKAVADYLIQQGITKNKISYVGYGSTKPIADNTTEQGREQNRRVEFKISSAH